MCDDIESEIKKERHNILALKSQVNITIFLALTCY